MRAFIAILFFLIKLSATTVFSQSNTVATEPCNKQECIEQKNLYKMCDMEGNIIKKCTSDPNNERGLRPFKAMIPISICAGDLAMGNEDHLYPNIKFNISSNPLEPYYVDVFRKRQVEACMERAARVWNEICPPQGPNAEYDVCCIKVRWTYDEGDMPNYQEEAYAVLTSPLDKSGFDAHTMGCRADCPGTVLRINRTRRFMRLRDDGTPLRFFITDRESIPYLPFPEYEYMDMEGMFLHELERVMH